MSKIIKQTNFSDLVKHDGEDYLLADKIKVSLEHALKLIKSNKFINKTDLQFNNSTKLWYCCNYKNSNTLIKIFYGNYNFNDITFINGDINDYRANNLIFKDTNIIVTPPSNYKILKIGEPVIIELGACAKEERNMYWKVEDENNITYYLMHIKDEIFTKVSKRDIQKVLNFNNKRPTWRLFQNGYVCCTLNINSKQHTYYLHQYIMDVHDEDLTSLEKTVDHINRDKLDNRKQNLRFANMAEQNSNRDKTARRCDAKIDVPHGIDLPKYMQYRKEVYCKEKNLSREFFIIVHPSLDKVWETTKSNNVAIGDKFRQAKLFLQLTENQITQSQYNKEMGMNDIVDLPKYIVINSRNDSLCFSFDYNDGSRYTLKIVIQSQDLQLELDNFIDSINAKYPTLKVPNYIIKNTRAANSLVRNIKVKEIITFENFDIEVMKKQCPDNFFITVEKNKPYIAYSKNINKKRYNMKQVMKTNDFQKELALLINSLNAKFNLSL